MITSGSDSASLFVMIWVKDPSRSRQTVFPSSCHTHQRHWEGQHQIPGSNLCRVRCNSLNVIVMFLPICFLTV